MKREREGGGRGSREREVDMKLTIKGKERLSYVTRSFFLQEGVQTDASQKGPIESNNRK